MHRHRSHRRPALLAALALLATATLAGAQTFSALRGPTPLD
jgi:hypothetical protein